MVWTDLAAFGRWLHEAEPLLPLAAALLSIGILFGCAAACWLSPSEKKDCIFHREVL